MGDQINHRYTGVTTNPYIYVGLEREIEASRLLATPEGHVGDTATQGADIHVEPLDVVQANEEFDLHDIEVAAGVTFFEVA